MGILTTPDKEKVKRAVPKASNKIIDATVARLYVAYPDRTQWTYTGLMGAVALVDDLVGHTFFLKLVDITGARGVLWDQELYVDFQYHQDRTFFHTFEIEDCLVGFLFEDTHDAAHFYKRVTTRHKHASKQTANNKNAVALKDRMAPQEVKLGNRGEFVDVTTGQRSRRARGVLYYDDQPPPEWRSLYAELAAAGISEDMIAENRQFIKDYIAQQGGPLVGLEPPVPRRLGSTPSRAPSNGASIASSKPSIPPKKTKKAPPPPPPAAVASPSPPPSYTPVQASTQAPAPPPPLPGSPAQAAVSNYSDSAPASEAEEASEGEPHETEESARRRFRLPPANAPIPAVSHSTLSSAPPQNQQNQQFQQGQQGYQGYQGYQNHQTQAQAPQAMSAPALPPQRTGQRPGPPPPPRSARAVPPPPARNAPGPGIGMNATGSAPPPPPPRHSGNAPPPPPSRVTRPVPTPNVAPQVAPQIASPQPPQTHFQPPPPPQRNYPTQTGSA
ncbi:hypothetical protein OXX69_011395, partial [Metschnikowia pulcherrima]